MKNKYDLIITICAAILSTVLAAGCGASETGGGTGTSAVGSNATPSINFAFEDISPDRTADKYNKVAESSDYTETEKIDDGNLTPVTAIELNDGQYLIDMESSSSMFKVADSLLEVHDGSMDVILRIESDAYLFLYPGTAAEASQDMEDNYISYALNDDGDQLYTIPVEALDKALPYASYSRKKEQWYDRTLLFKSSSLPDDAFKEPRYQTVSDLKLDDGTYYIDVDLEGGSGKASIESPALLLIQEGMAAAMITWSSSNYDYMIVDDDMMIDAKIVDDRSTFVIPVKGFDYKMPVVADTTAMSKPYEIDYTLYFDSDTIRAADPEGVAPAYKTMKSKETITPEYATGFTIDSFENDIYRVNVGQDKYLLVPKMTELPTGIPGDITVIRTPVSNSYVASTSSMDFFTQLGALSAVAFASPEADEWTDSAVSDKIKSDEILYVGKYNAPEYESLLTGKADIAIENTMIYHAPETLEKLKELSIPVFVDMTSYETDPRGRVEWIKIYGLLTGEYGKALRFFDDACRTVDEAVPDDDDTAGRSGSKPRVTYFYISPKGYAGVRKPGDYISKMIEMAGGEYIPSDIKAAEDDGTNSSYDMSMEDFFLKVKDADILIYNGKFYGEPGSIDELLEQAALLDEFKAVKEGRVYVSKDTMFQATCEAADVIGDLSRIVADEDMELTYFYKLK